MRLPSPRIHMMDLQAISICRHRDGFFVGDSPVDQSKRLQTARTNRAVPAGRIKASRLQTKIHGAGVKTAGLRLRQLPVRPIENNINVAQMPWGNRHSIVVRLDLDRPGRKRWRWTCKRRRHGRSQDISAQYCRERDQKVGRQPRHAFYPNASAGFSGVENFPCRAAPASR